MVSVEAGGDLLVESGVGQEVAGELFDGELVKGFVGVVCLDDPVAPSPHEAGTIVLVTIGVSEACGFEPRKSHCFAIAGRGEEPIDGALVGLGLIIGEEVGHFSGSGWDTIEIESGSAENFFRSGLGRGIKVLVIEGLENEVIDGIFGP